jgi:hypothetical protein
MLSELLVGLTTVTFSVTPSTTVSRLLLLLGGGSICGEISSGVLVLMKWDWSVPDFNPNLDVRRVGWFDNVRSPAPMQKFLVWDIELVVGTQFSLEISGRRSGVIRTETASRS